MTSLAWMNDALCLETDPDAFFPEDGVNPTAAYKVCDACPVRNVCLQYALANEITDGVWGGKSPNQRQRLARKKIARHPGP